MAQNDTTLGGPARPYPTTMWSQVLAAQDPSHPEYRARLESLVRAYWKPVYVYVRHGWKKSNEDAKDLTQSFFAHLLQAGGLPRIEADGRSFRSYLKQAVRNFLIDAERVAAVRRPVEQGFPLDANPELLHRWGPADHTVTPDQVYDQEWTSCLLDAALEILRKRLVGEGKELYFNVLQSYLVDPVAPADASSDTVPDEAGAIPLPTYASVARRWDLKETDVRNYLAYARARLREVVREEIAKYVGSESLVDDELRGLLGG